MNTTMKIITAILIIILALAAYTATAQTAVEEPTNDICNAGETCHWLMQQSSQSYILCDTGHFEIEVNGHDSLLIVCVSDEAVTK